MAHLHRYTAKTEWIGNLGQGTLNYKGYSRNHRIEISGKDPLNCSSDPLFRGDKDRHNPEELLVASVSGCHMLWYLHLCATNGVVVVEYNDNATGTMQEHPDGSGEFIEIVLSPRVFVQDESMIAKANALHHDANKMCFIARSLNFPVHHKPESFVATLHA